MARRKASRFDAAELHAVARDKDARAPQPLREVVDRLERLEREQREALIERDEIVREMREVGVPWVALARWTGVTPRRLDQIVNERD